MKSILTIFGILLFPVFISAQTENVNPDKTGEPWIVGGLRVPDQSEIDKIPEKIYPSDYFKKDLPSFLDNSTNQYFRPIFNQDHGSCGQASGVAYTFTYEINRKRESDASLTSNQFPSHYTYNFLNGGSGSNGSWMNDGWEIIKASGCPSVDTYGGISNTANYWMSGYDEYIASTENRVDEIFTIHVGTPEGLETLKYWLYDHMSGSDVGGIVNFAAGISNTNYQTSNDKIISWGYPVNHAMTIVGWDDTIEYDFNNDGSITVDQDINDDGVVDMKDWERGAVIMVNSWGSSWMGDGKAYIMYKLLAEPTDNGGIHSNKVYGITVKESQDPQLIMKLKMEHDTRNMISISAGVSENISANEPDYVLHFPMFNNQGGEYDMRGTSGDPIEIALDITPLLDHVESGTEAAYFLLIDEDDSFSEGNGLVYEFSILDNENNETISADQNISVPDNGLTLLSLTKSVVYDAPEIVTESLPNGFTGHYYTHTLSAENGSQPYKWDLVIEYDEEELEEIFPEIETDQLIPNNNDDGFLVKSIDFDFPFFGELYDEFTVLTDGSLVFEEGFEYLRTEEAIASTKMIGVFASDLMIYEADGDGIFYEGDQNSATFRWKTSLFDNQSANVDVALTLYPNGEMKFYYNSGITQGLSWATGVSNGTGNYFIADISGDFDPSGSQHVLSAGDFPFGMEITEDGLFQGIVPGEENSWNIQFKVTDNNNLSAYRMISFTTETSSVYETEDLAVNLFPNPFTDKLFITLDLESNSDVFLAVYDINGKLIRTEVFHEQNFGKYTIECNLNDLPEGIYMFELSTNKDVIRTKAILIK